MIGWLAENEIGLVQPTRDYGEARRKVHRNVPLSQATTDKFVGTGLLIHTTGNMSRSDILKDEEFNVTVDALRLVRSVSMYQWRQTVETYKIVNGTRDVFSYSKEWSTTFHNSSEFGNSENEEPIYEGDELVQNPSSFPVSPKVWTHEPITLGDDLILPPEVVERLDTRRVDTETVVIRVDDGASASSGPVSSANDETPQIGDVRVRWRVLRADQITVIGQVNAVKELISWTPMRGKDVLLVEPGNIPVNTMFDFVEGTDIIRRHIVRFVFIFWMVMAVTCMLKPLAEEHRTVRKIPIAVLIAIPIASLVITIAWIWHSPEIFGPIASLLAVVVGCICYVIFRRRKKQASLTVTTSDLPSGNDDDHVEMMSPAVVDTTVKDVSAQPPDDIHP